ncbi:hypothetical protein [Pandoraea terrae]|uniref:hypothetical protein n=1 Tax=Pandoraea terrae TaxID=1537710 RepID=UPI0012414834|nr:hypothetical protein [Pandoraea terrae]
MIFTNQRMRRYLADMGSVPVSLSSDLRKLIDAGFCSVDGCVFFCAFFDGRVLPEKDFIVSSFHDLSGYEASINKFHVEDYCDSDVFGYAVSFVNEFSNHWDKRLGKAALIMDYDNGPEVGVVCTVRFHLLREGESWLDCKRIDDFPSAILVKYV